MSTKETIDTLYNEAAAYFGITIKELKHRITIGGETLIHQYHTHKYPGGF